MSPDLELALATGRRRGRDLAAALPHGPRDRDEARPDAGDRGRSRGRGRAPADPRGRAARRRDPRRGAGRRRRRLAPLDRRPDRRDAELRARHPRLGDADRARGRTASCRSASSPRRRSRAAGGPSAEPGAFANGEPIHVSAVSGSRTAVLSFAIEDEVPAIARRAWHARGFGDFWAYMLVAEGAVDGAVDGLGVNEWDLAAMQVIVEEAGGRFSDFAGALAHRRRKRRHLERPPPRRAARRCRRSARSPAPARPSASAFVAKSAQHVVDVGDLLLEILLALLERLQELLAIRSSPATATPVVMASAHGHLPSERVEKVGERVAELARRPEPRREAERWPSLGQRVRALRRPRQVGAATRRRRAPRPQATRSAR